MYESETTHESTQADLPAFYYLDNIEHLLDQVECLYADILHPVQWSFLDAYKPLGKSARALLVRLLGRKGCFFRTDKLNYQEIGNLDSPIEELQQAGFLKRWTGENISSEALQQGASNNLLSLYSKPELLAWQQNLQLNAAVKPDLKTLKRVYLDAHLHDWLLQSEENLHQINRLIQPDSQSSCAIIELTDWLDETMDRFRLLYFGNLHQGMTDFILRDLGLQRYANYSLTADSRLFQTARQVEVHFDVCKLMANEDDLKRLNADQLIELHERLPFSFADRVIRRRTLRIRSRIGRQLERLDENLLAYRVYRHCPIPPARERRIRLLAKIEPEKIERTLAACRRLYLQPGNDAELNFARKFIPRLIKQHKKAFIVSKGTEENQTNTLDWLRVLKPPDIIHREVWITAQRLSEARSVEQLAIECLTEEQAGIGYYVENALFTALFGLLYWPVIFADVPGAFYHPFQRQPDDLYEMDFTSSRIGILRTVKQQLTDDSWKAIIHSRIQSCFGIQNPFVNWAFVTHARNNGCLQQALERLTSKQMLSISAYLLGDLRHRRSGLPDLIFFPDTGGFELVEVKGPNDSLQPQQISWLEYFKQSSIRASVLYIKVN